MTKSILLIDTPKSCHDCDYGQHDTIFYFNQCIAKPKYWRLIPTDIYDNFVKPDWCPLKPMPKPKEFTPLDSYEHDKDIYVYGWNACLEELEK